ncbi:hypothetical protein [Sphingobacterium athyrii]|uniref:Uncharacterized protein n=1 Tax=Sphingobacterium athyrii TaxID=2152717 RepID=A0A363NYL8_9SPHI|nr:hypothetical protein [Sphingobacterium athyrii]PUV25902.1 hypothetical protein DCO56_02705 [Sphingobacterium athyrii]
MSTGEMRLRENSYANKKADYTTTINQTCLNTDTIQDTLYHWFINEQSNIAAFRKNSLLWN